MSNIPLALSRPWFRLTRAGGVRRFYRHVLLALEIRKERRTLQRLDDRTLKDLGFSRSDAQSEGSRGFWDLPFDRTWV